MPSSYGYNRNKYLKAKEYSRTYRRRKVWREGLEVAMKIKGSQGRRRIKWVKPEHPYTAISPKTEVGANHNEALLQFDSTPL